MAKESKPANVTMFKFAGHVIPDDVLEKALLNYTSCFGMAVADGGKITLLRQPLSEMENQLADIKANQEFFKDKDAILFFGEYPAEYSEDAIQPIPLILNAENEPLAVCAMIGDFSDKLSEAHQSDALRQVSEYLGPKFFQMYSDVGNDMEKCLTRVKDNDVLGQELSRLGKGETAIAMLFAGEKSGTMYTFPGESKLFTDHDWGVTSNSFEDKPGAETPPEPVAEVTEDLSKLPPMLRKKREKEIAAAKAAATAAPAAPKTETKVETKVEPKASVPAVSQTEKDEDKYEWITPPSSLTNKKLKAWYEHRSPGGVKPHNWNQRPAIRVLKSNTTLKDQLQAKHGVRELPPAGPALASNKDTSTKHIQNNSGKPEAEVALPAQMPILTAGEKEKVEAFKKRTGRTVALLDMNGKAMLEDPTLLKYKEDTSPNFADQTNIPFSSTMLWKKTEMEELGGDSIRALAQLCHDYRCLTIKLLQEKLLAAPAGTVEEDEDLSKLPPMLRKKREKELAMKKVA